MREILRAFLYDGKPVASFGRRRQVLVSIPEVIAGKRVSGLFTVEPEVALTAATYVSIGVLDQANAGE